MRKHLSTSRKKLNLKKALLIVFALVLVGVGGWYLKQRQDSRNLPQSTIGDTSTVNYTPTTSQEKQETDQHKNDISKNQTTPTPTTTADGRTQVSPIITSANSSQVKGYVNGVVEDGGTCTYTFAKGSRSFTKITSGIANVSTTTCEPATLSPADVNSGTWSVTLHYQSAKYVGTSAAAVTFEVH